MARTLLFILTITFLVLVNTVHAERAFLGNDEVTLGVIANMSKGPGNITVTQAGKVIVSLHQFYGDDIRVAHVDADANVIEFAAAAKVNSVLGLQADQKNRVWLLDNAMRGGEARRLVAWHDQEDRLVQDIDLTDVTADNSFLNDLAVDAERGTIYIADPAGGENAAVIIVDVAKGIARRVLEGDQSVIPEDIDLIIDDAPVRIRMDDGSEVRPRIGINPIAIDKAGEWLYYGPMHAHSMYRIRTADLRNENLSQKELSSRVERWSDKPICDGISIDDAGNLYLGDLANNAIGVIGQDREYRELISDPRLSWVDAFSFGPDGDLYTVVNQLHRSAVLNGGESITRPPYQILKFKALAAGTAGR